MDFFKQAYNRDIYLDFLAGKFRFSMNLVPVNIDNNIGNNIDNNEVKSFQQLGFVTTSDDKRDGKQLPVFEIHIKPNTRLSRNRVQLRNLVAKQITSEDGALAVYVDAPNNQWRFSFIAIEYNWTDDGIKKEQTASKRFTYLLGENTKTITAEKRFSKLDKQSTLEDLKVAFAVEALNKEFYDKLYKWYEKSQDQVTFPNDEHKENHTHIKTSLIRLLTRLLFIWFLKEKELINADLFDKGKLQTLIDYQKDSSFYKAILQNLFFATLSTEIGNRDFRSKAHFQGKNKDYGNQYRYRYHALVKDREKWQESFSQTPFLNGGLFESLDTKLSEYLLDENNELIKDDKGEKIINQEHKKLIDEWDKTIRPSKSAIRVDGFSDRPDNQLKFDNSLFFNDDEQNLGLIKLFNQYQFTIEESTPLDVEVALDPELLGKVFENLLASYNPETGQQARKATGSFYTPREIVSYMVDESLKAYLLESVAPHDGDSAFYKDRLQDLMSVSDKTGALSDQDDALIYPEEIPELIKAISTIKIIDPAVGSGAFPMGILQRLVALLRVLDPDNTHWKQQQLDIANTLPDPISREQTMANIESIFSPQNAHNDYGRKLYLIESSIYGVDIQPIAIQICKLRFFISLTIEQNPNQDKNDNYGIKALPNLETKFIVANSLLPLGEMPDTGQLGIFDASIAELQQQLAQVRHKHFSAKTLKTKREYRDQDKELRAHLSQKIETQCQKNTILKEAETIINSEIKNLKKRKKANAIKINEGKQGTLLPAKEPKTITVQEESLLHDKIAEFEQAIKEKNQLLIDIKQEKGSAKTTALWRKAEQVARGKDALIHAQSKKIAHWDLYNQNAIADWFDPLWQFGIKDGFDIVIGNPPYIRQESIKEFKPQFRQNFSVFTGTADIYTYFYENGVMLLSSNGHLCYITSNKWMRAKYGEKLRGFFKYSTQLKQIIDFEGQQIFENATVDTNILLCGKTPNTPSLRHSRVGGNPAPTTPTHFQYQKQLPASKNADKNKLLSMAIDDLSINAYTLQAPEILALKKKIEQIGTPLKDWDIRIYRGVLTGFNQAFIIDASKRGELIAQDPKSAEIIKPVLRGRDIKAYEHHWAGLWLIATFPVLKINIDYYPAIKEHLLSFGKDRLEQAGKKLSNGAMSRKKTGNKWFETQDQIGYHAEFEKEKIVYNDITKKLSFSLSESGEYFNNTVYFIVNNDNLIFQLAVLNSYLINWYYKQISVQLGAGVVRMFSVYVEQLPIPKISKPEQQPFIDLVDKILNHKQQAQDTSALETQIDKMVYKLYHLTTDEINIIETKK